ncbi:MAG: CTP synthase [Candidatus Woesearchaeota archaeon]
MLNTTVQENASKPKKVRPIPQKKLQKTQIMVITGGVLSGLGKGVICASIGRLLKEQGLKVQMIKIDPYLNLDAGTMRPTEHGEVFVTSDGGETDQDIGTYERFLNITLSKENNITSGQVYKAVLDQERKLKYHGKCVEVFPHVLDEIQARIFAIIKKHQPDVLLVEVGGTVGDYQNILFLETFRVLKLTYEAVLFLHVVYLPIPNNLGEMKTKPAQHSVRMLNQNGIQPDLLITRSAQPLDAIRKEKLSIFGNVKQENVIESPDVENIYEVPLLLAQQRILEKIFSKLHLPYKEKSLEQYKKKIAKIKDAKDTVRIAMIGKYFDVGNFSLSDAYISVLEAIKHACWEQGIKPQIEWKDAKKYEEEKERVAELAGYDGVIVPGGFGSAGVEGKIAAIQFCRTQAIPYLGLCYGMQLAIVEFARSVCKLQDAHTIECNPNTPHPVITYLPKQEELLKKEDYGNTMRLGNYPAHLVPGTKVYQCYGKTTVIERHRHRYEVNPKYVKILEQGGLCFSGHSPDKQLMEFAELPGHPFFVGTQAHPEFLSTFDSPHPLFMGFIKAAYEKKKRQGNEKSISLQNKKENKNHPPSRSKAQKTK